ncbi:MAG: 2-amino-4-hydroxy-6-hydroxymethyldihydropteridine diphosphokinase [Victivallales bacterium]|nr:2-amino-4-hydroxy-6-hydroxymethyldihydropteridine diphosphokinase [Victivallales bacterium]
MNADKELIHRLEEYARGLLEGSPACHDWEHTLRVRRNALRLAKAEGADRMVVEAAALLHDIGRPAELADCGKTCHAELGAQMARDALPKLGVSDQEFIGHVAACVLTHRYRRRNPERFPQTIEAKVIFDADKLDGIGAIGIARSFHFAGRIGAKIHNRAEEALSEDSYSREDSAYREYLVKLRHVKESLLTESGRAMAEDRHRFMEEFFDELNIEAYGHRVAIALGGNIGDAEQTFRKAIEMLSEELYDIKVADVITTKPVDCVPGTPDFKNTAVIASFDGTPQELLSICQNIERALGRPAQHSSHESRTVDLDIILFDDVQLSTPNLTIPHPRMHFREFVLRPLAQLAPEWTVPGIGKSVRELFDIVN